MKVHRETRTLPGYELVMAPGGPKLKETTQDSSVAGRFSGVAPDRFPLLSPGRGAMGVSSKDGIYFKAQAYMIGEFLPDLRSFIAGTVERDFGPAADKTDLAGRYDFKLQFDRGNAPVPTAGRNIATRAHSSPNRVVDPNGSPGLFIALERQLGLKLVRVKKVPVDILVIDYMDKSATPN